MVPVPRWPVLSTWFWDSHGIFLVLQNEKQTKIKCAHRTQRMSQNTAPMKCNEEAHIGMVLYEPSRKPRWIRLMVSKHVEMGRDGYVLFTNDIWGENLWKAGFADLRAGNKSWRALIFPPFLICRVVMETASKHGSGAKDGWFQAQTVDQLHKPTTDPSYNSLARASHFVQLKTIA